MSAYDRTVDIRLWTAMNPSVVKLNVYSGILSVTGAWMLW